MPAVRAILDEIRCWDDDFVARFNHRTEEAYHRPGGADGHHDVLGGDGRLLLFGQEGRHRLAYFWNACVGTVAESERLHRAFGNFRKHLFRLGRRWHVRIAEREVAYGVFAELPLELESPFKHLADEARRAHRALYLVCYELHSLLYYTKAIPHFVAGVFAARVRLPFDSR